MPLEVLFPAVIDNTMRSDFVSCPHKFFRRHVLGLTKPGVNVHLHFGSCYAAALEAARKDFFRNHDTGDALKLACETAIEKWGDFEMPPSANTNERKKTLSALLLALQDYFREWPLDDDPLRIWELNGLPAVEFAGASPIPGILHPDTGEPLLYTGRFDMIGQHDTGQLWGLDDKTSGSLGDAWRKKWRLRGQFTGYVWLAAQYGVKLTGFMVRGVAPLKERTDTAEAICPRPPWMIEQWLRQLQDDVHMMIAFYNNYTHNQLPRAHTAENDILQGHAFPQVLDEACASFNGCTFLDLCSNSNPEVWAEEDFIVDRWNPLTRGASA